MICTNFIGFYKQGSGIHIKKENRGKFTASAKAAGESVLEHAKSVLNNPNATPLQKKRANFARNAAKWKHEEGSKIHKPNGHKSVLDNGWIPTKELKKKHRPGDGLSIVKGRGGIPGVLPYAQFLVSEDVPRRGKVDPLPYALTFRFIRNLENPRDKGVKDGKATLYDSRTAGYGTDIKSGHPELAKKIKSGQWTKLEAKDLAVKDMRKSDEVIMKNMSRYTNRPDTISFGPRLLMALARYHHGNIVDAFNGKDGGESWGKAVAEGDAETLKKIALKLAEKYPDRYEKIKGFNIYGF